MDAMVMRIFISSLRRLCDRVRVDIDGPDSSLAGIIGMLVVEKGKGRR